MNDNEPHHDDGLPVDSSEHSAEPVGVRGRKTTSPTQPSPQSKHLVEPAGVRDPKTTSPTQPSPQEEMAPSQTGAYNLPNTHMTMRRIFKKAFGSWWSRPIKSRAVDVIILLFLVGALPVFMYRLFQLTQSSQNAPTSNQPAQAKRYRIYYDTQQRRVLLIDTTSNEISPSPYRALFEQEQKLISKMEEQPLRFDSMEDAMEWLDDPQKGSRFVKKIDLKEAEQFEQSLRTVMANDIVEDDNEATLKAFLKRVNSERYQQSPTNIEQLKKLNPGVDAVRVNPGNKLMVFSRKKAGQSQ